MTITPNDITNKEFKKVFRGYDMDEVDEFLEDVVEEFEKLYRENIALKEKISNYNEKVQYYTNLEQTLQSTLLLAQSAADQAKESAKKDAELIIKTAQETSNEMIAKAREKVIDINKEADLLKSKYTMFRANYKSFLEAQLEIIDGNNLENTAASKEE